MNDGTQCGLIIAEPERVASLCPSSNDLSSSMSDLKEDKAFIFDIPDRQLTVQIC